MSKYITTLKNDLFGGVLDKKKNKAMPMKQG
jgi:hypothetical protein